MKVCIANDSFPPQIDGVANAAKNYADIINGKYGQTIVTTPALPENNDETFPYEIVRYPSIRIPKNFGVEYRAGYPFAQKSMEKLTKFNPEIIHSHAPFMSNYIGRELRRLTGAPLVFTYHTKFDIEIQKALKLKILQTSVTKIIVENMSACDEVWVVSEGAGKNLQSLGFKGEYRVMENGVDIPKIPADETILKDLRQKFGLERADVPVFLSVGRMKWYKNHKITINALKLLKNNGYNFKMIFVGAGTDAKEIQEYADECGISENCIFTGAVYDREILRNIYFLADLFVFPSTYDTNGIVVREAAACNLGSLLISGSCAAEGITDLQNGFLAEENAESVYRVLKSICESRERAHVIGHNAGNQLYISWETSVDRAVKRYHEVIENSKKHPKEHEFTVPEQGIKLISTFYKGIEKIKSLEND